VLRFVRRLHSYYGEVRLPTPVHHRLRLVTFPMRTRSAHGLWSDAGYPRFQRDPFARDVALDPGGTTMPRITASLMLRSTMKTVSAPTSSSFRGSLPHPTHQLCTLRVAMSETVACKGGLSMWGYGSAARRGNPGETVARSTDTARTRCSGDLGFSVLRFRPSPTLFSSRWDRCLNDARQCSPATVIPLSPPRQVQAHASVPIRQNSDSCSTG
jgi:hypothetical protein